MINHLCFLSSTSTPYTRNKSPTEGTSKLLPATQTWLRTAPVNIPRSLTTKSLRKLVVAGPWYVFLHDSAPNRGLLPARMRKLDVTECFLPRVDLGITRTNSAPVLSRTYVSSRDENERRPLAPAKLSRHEVSLRRKDLLFARRLEPVGSRSGFCASVFLLQPPTLGNRVFGGVPLTIIYNP